MAAGGPVATPYDVPVARLGAVLGQALGERFGGAPAVDPEIEARLMTVRDSEAHMRRWRELNPTATPDATRKKYEEFVAQSAFRHGLPDIGTQALAAIDERRKKERVQELQLAKLEREDRFGRATEKGSLFAAMVKNKQAGLMEVYPVGSADPNSGMVGMFDPATESLRFADGSTAPVTAFTFQRPQDPARYADSGGSSGGGLYSKNETARLRANFGATRNVQDNYLSLMSLMKEAESAGAQAYAGKAGQLTKVANRWADFVGDVEHAVVASTGQAYKNVTFTSRGESYDFRAPGDRRRWAANNKQQLSQYMPAGLKAEYAEAWMAAVTDLAYAKALTAEMGNTRSLSDADFKNAFQSVGGDLSSGKSLIKVFGRDSNAQYRRLMNTFEMYSDEAMNEIVDPKAWKSLNTAHRKIIELTGEVDGEVFQDDAVPDDDGIVVVPNQ